MRRFKARGVEVTLGEMQAQIDASPAPPKTKEAFCALFLKCGFTENDEPLDLAALAAASGRETTHAAYLLNIVLSVCTARNGEQAASFMGAEALSFSKLRTLGAEVTLFDLAVEADDTQMGSFLSFAEKVASV